MGLTPIDNTNANSNSVLAGRREIYTDVPEITKSNVAEVLADALVTHAINRSEIERLYKDYKGIQPILGRVKKIRDNICNKTVINHHNEIVSFKTGYLCGEPIQYIGRKGEEDISGGISRLNDCMLLCGKATKDKELIEWAYICGQAFRMVEPNAPYINLEVIPKIKSNIKSFSLDESPFNIYTLDPKNTFVIKSSAIGNAKMAGVTYSTMKDGKGVYSVYTNTHYFELQTDSIITGMPKLLKDIPRGMSQIPIIEYALNNARMGAAEVVLGLLEAINTVQSNRLDGIEQFIQSLIVLVNAEIDEERATQIRDAGIITLKSFGDNKPELKIVAEQLNQQETQTLVNYMYQTVLNIVGMPNRNGGSSTSDTGSAVIMRDGWESAEARAKSDELMLKEAERQFLKVVLEIMRQTVGTNLKLIDIETKFTRRNYDNIGVKAQVLTTMLDNEKIHPDLAFSSCGLFVDSAEAAQKSAEHYNEYLASQAIAPLEAGDVT